MCAQSSTCSQPSANVLQELSPPPKPALPSAPHAASLLKAHPSTTITTTAGKLCDLDESFALSKPL